MDIRKARNGEVDIAYECFGPPEAPPLLLIPGSGMQMVMWPMDLCTALVDRGFGWSGWTTATPGCRPT